MSEDLAKEPYKFFDIPDDVVKVNMDPVTGRLLSEDSPNAVVALFKKGTEPKRHHSN